MSLPALNRRIFFKSSLVGASMSLVASKANANTPSEEPFGSSLVAPVEQGQIYLPSPEEVLKLTGSRQQAENANAILSNLSNSELRTNQEIAREQEALTQKYRNEYLLMLDKAGPEGKNRVSPQEISTNAYQIMDGPGKIHFYYHNGVQNILMPSAQAIRPNWSRGRVFMFDAVHQTSYWTIWRSHQQAWTYLNWYKGSWGYNHYSSITKVERYSVVM